MATYNIEPERSTLHGHFSRNLPPVLTIEPGDTVHFRTLDAAWGLEPTSGRDKPRKKFEPRDPELDKGHALCGPVGIRGAKPGMVLGVHIDSIRPGLFGYTEAGGWSSPTNDWLGVTGEGITFAWTLDPDAMTALDQYGHTLALHPFMGVMGMPPAAPGIHPTAPPRTTGGNIDCKELVAGSTLYLPIEVEGGLFSVGDGHGVQGDGEVCTTAIECPMERVTLTFSLHDGPPLKTPRANTAAGWITLGFHEDLLEANMLALDAMLDLMMEQYKLSRLEALAMASLVVDMHVTQIVNGVRGVHAILPHDAIK
jgi:acetamidase/formamidase